MYERVLLYAVRISKSFSTDMTRIRFLSSMLTHVDPEVAGVIERLPASFTAERTFKVVNRLLVFAQG
jgi:hypothetical protein